MASAFARDLHRTGSVSSKLVPGFYKYTATFIKNGKRRQVTKYARDLLSMGRFVETKYSPDRFVHIK